MDLSYLEDMLLKVSDFVQANLEGKELDLNPVIAYGHGALVVDAESYLTPVLKLKGG